MSQVRVKTRIWRENMRWQGSGHVRYRKHEYVPSRTRYSVSQYSASHSFVTEYHIFAPNTVLTHITSHIWIRPVTNQTLSVSVCSEPIIRDVHHIFAPNTVLKHTISQTWMRPVPNETLSISTLNDSLVHDWCFPWYLRAKYATRPAYE